MIARDECYYILFLRSHYLGLKLRFKVTDVYDVLRKVLYLISPVHSDSPVEPKRGPIFDFRNSISMTHGTKHTLGRNSVYCKVNRK